MHNHRRKFLIADELLKGSIDLHLHGFPEITFDVRSRVEDYEIAELAENAGMLGFVLKSHIWPTVGRAYYLNQKFEKLKIFPSITLNSTCGGLSPISVESAARQGARVVFMPTWSAANDLKRGGFSSFMKEYLNSTKYLKENDGITIVNSDGIIRDEVIAILKIAYKYGMVIASGHISPNESLTLLKEINKIGNLPFIFSHPDSRSVGGTIEDMKAIIDLGGYVEICALGMMPAFQRISPNDIIKIIRNLGAENCVLSTDFFFEWAPTPPEMLRMAIATLMNAGLGENDVRRLIQLNPAKILGVEIK